MRLLALGATGLVLLLAGAADGRKASTLTPRAESCVPPAAAELFGATFQGIGRSIQPRVFAQVYAAPDSTTGTMRGGVLFLRGSPEWHGGGPRVARTDTDTAGGNGGRWIIERRFDSLTVVAFLHPRAGVLRVGGAEIKLDTANVLLLDYIDGVGGTPTVRAAGCVLLTPLEDAIERAMATLPAVRVFIE